MEKITEIILLENIGFEELGNGFYIDTNEFLNLYDQHGSIENVLDYYINEFKEKLKEPNLDSDEINDLKECIDKYPIIKEKFIKRRAEIEKEETN